MIKIQSKNEEGVTVFFQLTPTRLREVYRNPYSATRAAVRKAIQGKTRNRRMVYRIGSQSITWGAAVTVSSRAIQIGCQRFSGKSFVTLKKWALRKRA